MRIVSLCPSLTELVFQLGRGEDLVGVTKFCVHPAERVAAVERVGGTKDPKVERVIELAPDLVLMNDEENRSEDHDRLVAAGLRCHSSFPRDPEAAAGVVTDLAAVLEREAAGAELSARITAALDRARASAESRGARRFAYVIWRRPWMAAATGTYVSGLLEACGGGNVFVAAGRPYPEFDPTGPELTAADCVLLSSEPFPFRDAHREELREATGLAASRIRLVDGELLSWHGSRTAAGLDYASRLFDEVAERDA